MSAGRKKGRIIGTKENNGWTKERIHGSSKRRKKGMIHISCHKQEKEGEQIGGTKVANKGAQKGETEG